MSMNGNSKMLVSVPKPKFLEGNCIEVGLFSTKSRAKMDTIGSDTVINLIDSTDIFSDGQFSDALCFDIDLSLFDNLLQSEEVDFIQSESEQVTNNGPDIPIELIQDTKTSPKICLVCGNDAGRHSYYGGQVCNSCRAFFRRAIVGNSYEEFRCLSEDSEKTEQTCVINSKSRKSCQACRFQGCLRAGMQPKWIMTDSEVKVRRERRLIMKQVRMEKKIPRHHVVSPKKDLAVGFSNDDLTMLEDLTNKTLSYAFYHLAKFYAKHVIVHDDVLTALNTGSSLGFNSLRMLDKFIENVCIGVYNNMEDTKQLPLDDSREIIVLNSPLVVSVVHSIFTSPADSKALRTRFLRRVNEELKDKDVMAVGEKIKQLKARDGSKSLKYEQFYASPWSPDGTKEERHAFLSHKMLSWMPRKTPTSSFDEIAFTLLLHIILFSAEFLFLQNRQALEQVQLKYMHFLYQYLKVHYPKDGLAKFVDGMLLISYAREAMEIRLKRLPI